MKTTIAALTVAASLACPAVAHANIYHVSFTASNFNSSNGQAALQDPVAGSITFTTPSAYGLPTVQDIDLTIGSHTYTASEIVAEPRGGGYEFGGKASGLNNLVGGTDDFYLDILGRGEGFGYTTAGLDGIWATWSLSLDTEELAAVPEPGSLALLLAGAAGVGAMRRRRRV